MNVRTRFAPSPTGFFHIGNLRTALYSYALAKRHKGQFILRIEDTDRERFVPGAEEYINDVLDLFGLSPDESPMAGGDFGPYRQSERLETYKKYAEDLVNAGYAYYCFLAGDELEGLKNSYRKQNKMFRSPYRDAKPEEIDKLLAEGRPFVIRFKMSTDETILFTDGVQGKMEVDSNDLDDWVMIKSDGFPTYNFAVVIDDYLMKVSHVFRGVEFIPSTPKHVLLYKVLGWELPEFFHLPVLMDPGGGKMSKRKGAVSVKEFLQQGYLPEALLNFLMLLGWSAPIKREHGEKERELFSLEEFIKLFDVKDLNKSNPVFNRDKLDWFNQQYISNLDSEVLLKRFVRWIKDHLDDKELLGYIKEDGELDSKVELVRSRAKYLPEVLDMIKFFYRPPEQVDFSIRQLKRVDRVNDVVQDVVDLHSSYPSDTSKWDNESWVADMKGISDKHGIKPGDSFMVLRVALVGEPFSPPLFETMQILGRDEVLRRLSIRLEKNEA